jgi:hypothetical protein
LGKGSNVKCEKGFSLAETMVAIVITMVAGMAIFQLGNSVVAAKKRVESDVAISQHMSTLKTLMDNPRQCNGNFAGLIVPPEGTSAPVDVKLVAPDYKRTKHLAMAGDMVTGQITIRKVSMRLYKSLDPSHKAISLDIQFEQAGTISGGGGTTVSSQNLVMFVEVDPGSNVISKCDTVSDGKVSATGPSEQEVQQLACQILKDRTFEVDPVTGECKKTDRVPCINGSGIDLQCPLDGKVTSCSAWNYGTAPEILVARGYTDESQHKAGAPDYVTSIQNSGQLCHIIFAVGLPVNGTNNMGICCKYPPAPDETDPTDPDPNPTSMPTPTPTADPSATPDPTPTP